MPDTHSHCCGPVSRRVFLTSALCALAAATVRARADAAKLPAQVAGVDIPRTPLARAAEELARRSYPNFLFNHCMRTYLFGALSLKAQHVAYDAELAFVAAAVHDVGLLPPFSTPHGSFEIDGANRAEALVREAHRSEDDARRVWNAIVMHDMRSEYAAHQSPEAQLVGIGAGADVVDPGDLDKTAIAEVLKAFPRLHFKTRFTDLLVDHCRRKPTVQIGWLDGLCRETVPGAPRGSVKKAIASAPFKE